MDEERCWPGGNPGEAVPAVEAADLHSVWNTHQDIEAQHPGKAVAVGATLLEHVCSHGADIGAITYRSAMLQMLEMCGGDLLAPWRQSVHFHEDVFRVAARIPMKWMEVGVPQQGLPFDVNLFLQELSKESL